MKKRIVATTMALGLAGIGGVGLAQDQATLHHVVVTGVPASYETYVADLHTGYPLQLQALVGHTHRQYVQARRAAEELESLRMQGLALQPLVSVAIDDSSGPGVARRFQLIDAARETIAIVNVYCKRVVHSGGPHCRMDAEPSRVDTSGPRLASTRVGDLQLAEASPQK